jgi:hypothetical protein
MLTSADKKPNATLRECQARILASIIMISGYLGHSGEAQIKALYQKRKSFRPGHGWRYIRTPC